jgi:hypothetical protein
VQQVVHTPSARASSLAEAPTVGRPRCSRSLSLWGYFQFCVAWRGAPRCLALGAAHRAGCVITGDCAKCPGVIFQREAGVVRACSMAARVAWRSAGVSCSLVAAWRRWAMAVAASCGRPAVRNRWARAVARGIVRSSLDSRSKSSVSSAASAASRCSPRSSNARTTSSRAAMAFSTCPSVRRTRARAQRTLGPFRDHRRRGVGVQGAGEVFAGRRGIPELLVGVPQVVVHARCHNRISVPDTL